MQRSQVAPRTPQAQQDSGQREALLFPPKTGSLVGNPEQKVWGDPQKLLPFSASH